ncbi:flagellar basal body P-ring formation protein FlgA [Hyphomonas neptunium ATCC 15444]|uniref:Flagella basal body P-ring formation protein FlgA n=2 Tax=Hyphomonas TaxID=85 RepID=Q0C5K5_HYPNA|nr:MULTISPECIES: flagellar basal body P-ring formation chaperone FlgA [Hyphomonas]ABI75840.1 flagellar basal body P-ring formation protein FlgA [Hyphomonas neptunium ATCC 15444]KCZ95416.1 flagellar basal body P-ring formation protein FlgA [Hyphomonas hirschiana VP5]
MSVLFALGFTAFVALTDASSMIASEVIRAGDIVTPVNASAETGDVASMEEPVIGREAKRTIYAGQPVTMDNTRPARLVTRNQIVTVKYIHGGLEISTTGRAMGEASLNEPVTVLNLESRQMVQGIVQESGWVLAQ